MNIVFVGAGNLATSMGMALACAGHKIVQVYSRTMESAERLAGMLSAEAINDLGALDKGADVYVLAVKDSVIKDLLSQICIDVKGKVFLHTSGSMPMGVFAGYFEHYGVLYPLQTFSKERVLDFNNIPCFVEGNCAAALSIAENLAKDISENVRRISSEQRRQMHLAAVFACNFANHCFAIAAELLEKNGLEFDVLLPLIDETVSKVHDMHPRKAQTGPAVRFDENIIGKHIEMLEDNMLQADIYSKMSRSIFNKTNGDDKL